MAVPQYAGVGGGGGARRRKPRVPPQRVFDRPQQYPRPPVRNARAVVAQQQAFLKARGYNLVVDGVLGPKTQSALNDWHSGVKNRNPGAWSQKRAPVDDGRGNLPKAPSGHVVQDRVGRRVVVPKGKGATTQAAAKAQAAKVQPKAGTQRPVRTGPGRPNLPAAPLSNVGTTNSPSSLFDPEVLARASAEAKYGPILAELMRQEKQVRSAGANRVAEIGDMYGGYTRDIQARNAEAAALRSQTTAATGGLTAAIAQGVALDPDAATELAVRGDIESDYAGQMAQSAGDFDRRMAGAAQQGGVFAAGQAQRQTAGQLEELGAERLDTVAQKGADLVATRQEMERWQMEQLMAQNQQNFQQGMAEREFGLQQQLGKAQVADASTKNAIAMAELQAANALLPLQAKKTQAELEALYADINRTNAQTYDLMNPRATPPDPLAARADRRAGQEAKTKQQEAVRRQNLEALNNMYAQTRHETGPWRVGMTQTWTRAKAALRASGIDPNSPRGKRLLKQYADINGIKLGAKGNPVSRTKYSTKK